MSYSASMGVRLNFKIAAINSNFHILQPYILGYCFNPCGHTVSALTAKHWVEHKLPKGTQLFQPACPFCAIPFNPSNPTVKLILQASEDTDPDLLNSPE